jgi:UDP-2,4-diacetamido-2,4,6-trideoxy-beta-L-altropyranose hydrolase
MTIRTLIIRADASVTMGTGHVMRCVALAQAWQDDGGAAVFAMAQSTPAINEYLRSEQVEVVPLKSPSGSAQNAEQVMQLARDRAVEWVVVDGYQFTSEYQRTLKAAGLKVLFVDDTGQCEHYYADLVLNQNAHANEKMYGSRETDTQLLLGPRYAMLRREFKSWRRWKREVPAAATKLLVTIGGSDPDGLTLRLVQALPKISSAGMEVMIVVGGSNPCMTELQREVAGMGPHIQLVSNAGNMPELMAQSDIAVICGGGTAWELLYMGCAILSYARDDVQEQILKELSAIGAARSLGAVDAFQETTFARAIEELIFLKDRRVAMAGLGRKLVDGKGTGRVLTCLAQETPKIRPALSMAPVTSKDRDSFLKMAEQHFRELNRDFTPDQDWQDYYFDNIQKDCKYSLQWIVADGQRAGFILFGSEMHRFLPRKTGVILELFVVPEQRRRGIARVIAEQAICEMQKSCPSKIQLEVVEGNAAAVKLWKSMGFRKVTDRFVLAERTKS